jgi:hypothetical protein
MGLGRSAHVTCTQMYCGVCMSVGAQVSTQCTCVVAVGVHVTRMWMWHGEGVHSWDVSVNRVKCLRVGVHTGVQPGTHVCAVCLHVGTLGVWVHSPPACEGEVLHTGVFCVSMRVCCTHRLVLQG